MNELEVFKNEEFGEIRTLVINEEPWFIGKDIATAYTTVVIDNISGWCGVFFGERLAYVIDNPNKKFFEDLRNGNMESVSKKGKYKK